MTSGLWAKGIAKYVTVLHSHLLTDKDMEKRFKCVPSRPNRLQATSPEIIV